MRNCNTLPLSSNPETMREFMEAVDEILKRGDLVLVYPEQSLWPNYRKPKPLKRGAFSFAAKAGVPILPIFITMEDGENYDSEGFKEQIYTIHIFDPIYPEEGKSPAQNAALMMQKNYELWKGCYEKTYGIPLTYLCDENKKDVE
jgi:1-acyl-sn-glycerol-3-phosphate acyltransferase